MKDNYNLTIKGHTVQLVPYKQRFVAKYHEWMKDPYILEMTASEPLSIEEEYEMQQSWAEDANKCSFIVLSLGSDDELDRMAGDVNLFLNDRDDKGIAEIEVMIAESGCRNKGFAKEAIMLMMQYGLKLGIWRFYAKINETNEVSIGLFKRLGFVEVNYVAAFQEYELEFRIDEQVSNKAIIEDRCSHAEYIDYE